MKDMKKILLAVLLAVSPLLSFAEGATIWSLAGLVSALLNAIIPILFSLAVVYFLWGVVKYVISAEADDKEKAKSVVVRGVIGLFVMSSVWGLVAFIGRSVGIDPDKGLNVTDNIEIPSPLPPGF